MKTIPTSTENARCRIIPTARWPAATGMFMLMPGCIIMSRSIMAACPRHTNEAMHKFSGVQNPLLVAADWIICHRAMPAPPASPASAPYPASRGTWMVLGRVRTASLISLTSGFFAICRARVPGTVGRDPGGCRLKTPQHPR